MNQNIEIKLYNLEPKDQYPILISKGFDIVKSCGQGTKGFMTVIALNFIESIILRQKTAMPNIIFIQSM